MVMMLTTPPAARPTSAVYCAVMTRTDSMASTEELKYAFRGLAEEEKRHKALAQDRYDLEILTEN